MKYIRMALLLLIWAAALAGCKKSDDAPYVVFRDTARKTLTSDSPVPVGLNSTHTIYSETGYERSKGNNLDYEWNVDNGGFEQYSAFDGLKITAFGRHNNLSIEKASFTITFGEDIVRAGSTVTIRVRDQGSLSGSLTFKVE